MNLLSCIWSLSEYCQNHLQLRLELELRPIMLEKYLVLLEKCSVLLENFFKTYARDRSVIARNFLMLEMLDHFSARDRSDRKFKIKNCARDRSDRKFQCSKCSRSMFFPLGLNSNLKELSLLQNSETVASNIIANCFYHHLSWIIEAVGAAMYIFSRC